MKRVQSACPNQGRENEHRGDDTPWTQDQGGGGEEEDKWSLASEGSESSQSYDTVSGSSLEEEMGNAQSEGKRHKLGFRGKKSPGHKGKAHAPPPPPTATTTEGNDLLVTDSWRRVVELREGPRAEPLDVATSDPSSPPQPAKTPETSSDESSVFTEAATTMADPTPQANLPTTKFTIVKHRMVDLGPTLAHHSELTGILAGKDPLSSVEVLQQQQHQLQQKEQQQPQQGQRRHSSLIDAQFESNVLRKVASLTLDRATVDSKQTSKPKFQSPKLDFQLYEKFEGQMLLNWLGSSLGDDLKQQSADWRLILTHLCSHLLTLGVLRQVTDKDAPSDPLFRPDFMYYWAHNETVFTAPPTPGRLSKLSWPPSEPVSPTPDTFRSDSPLIKKDLDSISLSSDVKELARINKEQKLIIDELQSQVDKQNQEKERTKTLADIQTLTSRMRIDFASEDKAVQTDIDTSAKKSPSFMCRVDKCAQTSELFKTIKLMSTQTSLEENLSSLNSLESYKSAMDNLTLFNLPDDELKELAVSKSESSLINSIKKVDDSKIDSVSCNGEKLETNRINEVVQSVKKLEEKGIKVECQIEGEKGSENGISVTSEAPAAPPPPMLEATAILPLPILEAIAPPLPPMQEVCALPSLKSGASPPPQMPEAAPPPSQMPERAASPPPAPTMEGGGPAPAPPTEGGGPASAPPTEGGRPPPAPPMMGGGPPPPPPAPPMAGGGPPPPPPAPPMAGGGPPPPPPAPPMEGCGPPPAPPMAGGGPPPPPPAPPMAGSGPPPPPPAPPMEGSGPPPPPPAPPTEGGGPPPPPLPGVIPPPPPTPGGLLGGPPLPPPPDSSPVPFPTPPAGGWNAQRSTFRKQPLLPPVPMKPLYWTRVVIPPTVPPEEVVSPSDKKLPLWSELEEANISDIDEFTSLFSRQVVDRKNTKKKVTKPSKAQALKVLDSKRSQNVGILATSLHLDFSEIENAVYNFDTSVVSLESLQQIYEIRATSEELKSIKEKQLQQPDQMLDKPEQFLLELGEIPHFAERIACFMFQAHFLDTIVGIESKLNNLKSVCQTLMTSESLKSVLSIILALGNFMNGGNRQRGQADGFGLEILSKLKDVKSKDNSITLLHFIVKVYMKNVGESSGEELALPVPEPGDVERASAIIFEDVENQIIGLKKELEACVAKMEIVIEASTAENVEPYKSKMEAFITSAQSSVKDETESLDECKQKFLCLLKFYHYQPTVGKLEEVGPKDFFPLWSPFCSDFKDLWKKEQQRRKAKLKEALQKQKDIKKGARKVKQGGFKSTLLKFEEEVTHS